MVRLSSSFDGKLIASAGQIWEQASQPTTQHVRAILYLIPHEDVVLAEVDAFLVSDANVEIDLREPGDFVSRNAGLHNRPPISIYGYAYRHP
jgi:hypothetical protein